MNESDSIRKDRFESEVKKFHESFKMNKLKIWATDCTRRRTRTRRSRLQKNPSIPSSATLVLNAGVKVDIVLLEFWSYGPKFPVDLVRETKSP